MTCHMTIFPLEFIRIAAIRKGLAGLKSFGLTQICVDLVRSVTIIIQFLVRLDSMYRIAHAARLSGFR